MRMNADKYRIPNKAELVMMCSKEEIEQRGSLEVGAVNSFETDPRYNEGKLFIKAYERSAADKVMNNPLNIRPPEVLYKCVEYLRDCIVDLDMVNGLNAHFMDIYSFVRDREKCVAQDFIIIDEQDSQYYIKVSFLLEV